MGSKRLGGIGLAAAFALAACGASAQTVGKPAPDFRADILDGGKVSLADFKGQVLIVNVWATWCVPCRRELPLLDAYYRLQKAHGLRVLALTTEDSVPVESLRPLAKAIAIPIVRHLKSGGFMSSNYDQLGGVPTNYVIDRGGVVRYAEANAFTLDTLNKVLLPLLSAPAPADPAPAQTAAR